MKQIAAIILLILFTDTSFGQQTFLPNDISKAKNILPNKIKRIVQYEDGIIMNIREYDTLKNQIFNHYKQYVSSRWNGEYLTMITGNVYNNVGQEIMTYQLHSNAGLSIWYREYDSIGNNTKIYEKQFEDKDPNLKVNSNPYMSISEIKSFDDLIKHPLILKIESNASKSLILEKTYDSLRNIKVQVEYYLNKDTISYRRMEYDSNNNQVYVYSEIFKNSFELFYEYKTDLSIYSDVKTKKMPSMLVQCVRMDYNTNEKRKSVTDITFYKYNDKNLLEEKTTYNGGSFQSKVTYKYNENNLLTNEFGYIYNSEKLIYETVYEYNKEGNVTSEINKDYRLGKQTSHYYRYEYDYYD